MTDANNSNASKAHLAQLPIKSFNVAPGDVIGGMVYVMDKPLGIEEGMIGISIDSVPYRAYIEKQMDDLIKGKHPNKILRDRFNKKMATDNQFKIRIDGLKNPERMTPELVRDEKNSLISAMMKDQVHETKVHPPSAEEAVKLFTTVGKLHEIKGLSTYTVNTGMGGLLFEGYKAERGVKEGDRFFIEIKKLMVNSEGVNDDKAYMVKQDGELILGGTGPGLGKILKTTMGKTYLQPLVHPGVVLATGGSSAVAFVVGALAWKGTYLRDNNPVKTNSDAIVESIATKMAAAKGFPAQEIDTINGRYDKNDSKPKIGTIVTWTLGCEDLSGHLAGGTDKGVAVSLSEDFPIKQTLDGKIIQREKVKEKDKKDRDVVVFKFFEIDPNNLGSKKEVAKEAYDAAPHAVSEDTIYGLGESLITLISLGDRDGIGSKGQNKAMVPLDKDKIPEGSNYTHEFYAIDCGKAYIADNPIVGSLRDDFSFVPPGPQDPYKNYSMLYDNPLTDKMKGVYLMAALRDKLNETTKPKKSDIVAAYQDIDPVFAAKLKNYPEPTPGKDGDLALLKGELKKYQDLAAKAKENKEPKKEAEYNQYVAKLTSVQKIATETDNKILSVFEDRLKLMPTQINLLDNIEKLTAKKASTLSPDGTVLLNHIRVDRDDRVPWQIEPKSDGAFRLYCALENAKPEDLNAALDKLKAYAKDKPELNALVQNLSVKDNKLEITLNKDQLATFTDNFKEEEKVAKSREDLKTAPYRTQEDRDQFHRALKEASKPNASSNAGLDAREDLAEFFTMTNEENLENTVALFEVSNETLDSAPTQKPKSSRLNRSQSLPSIQPKRETNALTENQSYTPQSTRIPLRGDLVASQDNSIKNVMTYLQKPETLAAHKNIKNLEELKSLPIPSETNTQPPKPIVVKLENPSNQAKIDISVQQSQAGNQVQYFAPKNLSDENFVFTAKEVCRLAVLSAQPGAKFDFSNAPVTVEKKAILEREFRAAVAQAIQDRVFPKENAPRLKTDPQPVPRIEQGQARSQTISTQNPETPEQNNQTPRTRPKSTKF